MLWLVVIKLSETNSQLEVERSQSQSKCDALRLQNENLLLVDSSKISVDEHVGALADLNR